MIARTAASDLNRVAIVSDQIRHIARQAFLMQLHATNAMVTTRSKDIRVPGFEVVSEQMRQLSRELGTCLGELRSATVRWLQVVSRRTAAERSEATLAEALQMSAAAERVVAPVVARVRRELDSDTAGGVARRSFVIVLDDARRLAATGCILARTAKLEATYGGDLATQLAESAAAFTELADSVDESVRTIARRLADGAWSPR